MFILEISLQKDEKLVLAVFFSFLTSQNLKKTHKIVATLHEKSLKSVSVPFLFFSILCLLSIINYTIMSEKCSFFQAAVISILLYGCTTWMLTKQLKKKLDGNYTRMLRAILNESWWQHPTRHQLYSHLTPVMKTIQVRWTRHAGHCWRS